MAVTRGALHRIREKKVAEVNKVFDAVVEIKKTGKQKENNQLMRELKLESANFYTALRRLQLAGRLDKQDNRVVLMNKPMSLQEYLEVGDPYGRANRTGKRGKKPVTKPVTKSVTKHTNGKTRGKALLGNGGGPAGLLSSALEVPIERDKELDELTIKGTPEAIKKFMHIMGV